jgi:arsenate reductase (thioredoxin)
VLVLFHWIMLRLIFLPEYIRLRECTLEIDMPDRLKVLFLCTGNSCRSQMAEGWATALRNSEVEAFSAGTNPHGMNPRAVKAMADAGVDISAHQSKHVDDLKDVRFDYVVTVCGQANETCPMFPGSTKVVHVGFDDPPQLAKNAATEEEAMGHYRRVCDEIRAFVQTIENAIPELNAVRS